MTDTVTDVQVEINAVLGVEEPDPRLITAGQTSGSSFFTKGLWEHQTEYILATPTGF